jgi:hypothetical protein
MTASLKSAFEQATGGETPKREPATRPFSIRLSKSERETIEAAAGTMPVGTYVRHQLLQTAAPRRGKRGPVANTAALGQILGLLGKSSVCKGLADLASAARSGSIALTPEIEAQIVSACEDVRKIRRLLLSALGFPAEVGQ